MAVNIRVDPGNDPAWFLYSGNAKDAPELLSNLVTAMITMATLVVSITMVVLTLAAQQLGPRLIRSFMADRRTQATLGLFVGTVVYLLLVLRSTYGAQDEVPNLAVSGGTALVLVCLIALLIFVHHLATSIIADNTIDRVGDSLDADVARLLPGPDFKPCPPPSISPRKDGMPIRLSRGGYVQAIDHHRLAELAAKADAMIELAVKAGDHTIEGETWAFVAPPEVASAEFQGKVEDGVLLGNEQESIQDLQTSIRQLVEVALRALSPSLNDPYHGHRRDRPPDQVAGQDHASRAAPSKCGPTRAGPRRLVAPGASFADIVATAFNQIRQHSTGTPAVLIHLAKAMGKLMAQADTSQRAALAENLKMVMETGRRDLSLEQDLAALEQCVKSALGVPALEP